MATQRIADLPDDFRECVCLWQLLRKLGFPSDDLFFFADSDPARAGIEVRRGELAAKLVVGPPCPDAAAFGDLYRRMFDEKWIDEWSTDEWLEAVDASEARRNAAEWIAGLVEHGIQLPRLMAS